MRIARPQTSSRAALTIVEMLLVVSLVGVLSVSIYQVLVNGIRIWDQGTRAFAEEDVAIFFEKFARDLHNSCSFSGIDLQGDQRIFQFPAIIQVQADPRSMETDPITRQIGQVRYGFDPVAKVVFRQVADYGQAQSKKFPKKEILVKNVESFAFRYFYSVKEGLDAGVIAVNRLPSLVEAEIRYRGDKDLRKMVRRVGLPTARNVPGAAR